MGKTLDDKFSHTWDTMTHEGLLMFSEKFAELIVRECAKEIIRLNHNVASTEWEEGYEAGFQTASTIILKHFGVEE